MEPKKLAILRVLQILWEHSDADHPLRQERIVSLLDSEYGITLERKAVGRDVALLRDEAGFDIQTTDAGVFLGARLFEDAELRLLIDGVLASRHIAAPQSREMIDKICKLSSENFARHLDNIHTVNDWNKTENKSLFYHIELVDEAIETGRTLTFTYNKYGADKKLKRTSNQRVSPYQLILHNQRYYLMCYNLFWKNVTYYRMDRITNMKLSDAPAVPLTSLPGYERGVDYRAISAAMPYMYAGKPERVTFVADEWLTDQIVDWFGKDDVTIREAAPAPDGAGRVEVSVRAVPLAMRYWALQYAESAEIIRPETLRNEVKDILAKAAEKYGK